MACAVGWRSSVAEITGSISASTQSRATSCGVDRRARVAWQRQATNAASASTPQQRLRRFSISKSRSKQSAISAPGYCNRLKCRRHHPTLLRWAINGIWLCLPPYLGLAMKDHIASKYDLAALFPRLSHCPLPGMLRVPRFRVRGSLTRVIQVRPARLSRCQLPRVTSPNRLRWILFGSL